MLYLRAYNNYNFKTVMVLVRLRMRDLSRFTSHDKSLRPRNKMNRCYNGFYGSTYLTHS